MNRFYLFSLIFIAGCAAKPSSKIVIPKGFELTKYPSHAYFEQLPSSSNAPDYEVYIIDNQLVISDQYHKVEGDSLSFSYDSIVENLKNNKIRPHGMRHQLKFSKGFLIGTDAGEWSGSLFWVNQSGTKHRKLLDRVNVNQFFYFKGELLVVEGLSHMGWSSGTLLRVNEDLSVDTLHVFERTTPNMLGLADDKLLLLSENQILELDKLSFKPSIFLQDMRRDWWGAQTMVEKNNILYVGMRGGVLAYDLANGKRQWLKKIRNRQ